MSRSIFTPEELEELRRADAEIDAAGGSYYAAHREERLSYQRRYYETHREEINARRREYYETNRAGILSRQREKRRLTSL